MKTIKSLILVITLVGVSVFSTATAQYGSYNQQAISNPYCNVPTYVIAYEPRNAGINFDRMGRYYITVAKHLTYNKSNLNAMLAHECGHVVNRHNLRNGSYGQIKHQELQADCHAARALSRNRDTRALRAFERFVGSCGNYLSGPMGYPTCNERLQTIRRCSNGY